MVPYFLRVSTDFDETSLHGLLDGLVLNMLPSPLHSFKGRSEGLVVAVVAISMYGTNEILSYSRMRERGALSVVFRHRVSTMYGKLRAAEKDCRYRVMEERRSANHITCNPSAEHACNLDAGHCRYSNQVPSSYCRALKNAVKNNASAR